MEKLVMKYFLFAAVFCLVGSNAMASETCSNLPAEIGGLMQTNPDGSISVLFPTLDVSGRTFKIAAGNSAVGLCKLMGKTYVSSGNPEEGSKVGTTFLSLTTDGVIAGVLKSVETKKYYHLTSVVCK